MKICIPVTFCCGVFMIFLCGCSSKHNGLNWHNPHLSANMYEGFLSEQSEVVEISPPLFTSDKDFPQLSGLICDYRLYQLDHIDLDIPFTVSVLNKKTGEAQITLQDGQNIVGDCKSNLTYNYMIRAIDCGVEDIDGSIVEKRHSHKSRLSIRVADTNRHDPYFPKPQYFLEVEGEIKSQQPLISVKALDNDCSQRYGDICRYELLGDSSDFFEITVEGTLTAKQHMSAVTEPIPINISVLAYDCGDRKSNQANVSIMLKPICHARWSAVEEQVDFPPERTSAVKLIPDAALDVCIPPRDIVSVQITVKVDGDETQSLMECDRDSYTVKDARKLCDAKEQHLLELLPSALRLTKQYDESRTNRSRLPSINRDAYLYGAMTYEFNGENQALKLKDPHITHTLNNLNLSSVFSVFFRLFLNEETTSEGKQTIVCKSDDTGHSRHHMSIYVQNCHLMLLLRSEHGPKTKLKPAEWHWKIDGGKKCTGRWFSILLNIDFPDVTLFLNEELQSPFLIADDYRMHNLPTNPQWTVGAAWEGRESKLKQHFKGKLSDFVFYVGELEDISVFKCLHRCKEGLLISGKDSGVVMSTTDREFSLKVLSDGSDVTGVLQKLHNLTYFNERRFPAPGQRRVTLETRIICTPTAEKCPYVPPHRMYVMVLPPPDPEITIIGRGQAATSEANITGNEFYPFDDVIIMAEALQADNYSVGLDSCLVSEVGETKNGEFKVRPSSVLDNNQLYVETIEDGFLIRGIKSMATYQKVLRSLSYRNLHIPDAYDVRFRLVCSELNGRYYSNSYIVTVTVFRPGVMLIPAQIPDVNPLIPSLNKPQPAPAGLLDRKVFDEAELAEQKYVYVQNKQNDNNSFKLTALVVGICISLIVVMVVAIAIHVRLQGCGGDSGEEDDELDILGEEIKDYEMENQEYDWDNSAMSIIANPMESLNERDNVIEYSEIDNCETSQRSACECRDQSCDRDARVRFSRTCDNSSH